MSYCRTHYKLILIGILPCIAYNLYYIFLLSEIKISYLIYLDFLITAVMTVFYASDIIRYRRIQRKKQELMQQDYIIYQEFQELPEFQGFLKVKEDSVNIETDIAAHDVLILKKQLQVQFDMNCDMQDYIAKWCHEIKIPLSASLLMAEKIEDTELKESFLEQLERMNVLLTSALLGTKMQSSLFDLQVCKTSLLKCIRESIHNNQFFLIRKHFTLDIQPGTEDLYVYTDPLWLTYVLDQLISNSVKYSKENPLLKIYTATQGETIQLYIEDNGEGIKESDIRRIFEKGYIGSNHHNGQYKSTGMGLYMACEIIKKLEHEITVESEYNKGTRFTITFKDNREYFNI